MSVKIVDFKLRNTIRDKAIEAVILVIAYAVVRRVKPSMVADYSWLVAVEFIAAYLLFGVLWAIKTWRSGRAFEAMMDAIATDAVKGMDASKKSSGVIFGPHGIVFEPPLMAPSSSLRPPFVDPNPTVATERELKDIEPKQPKQPKP